MNDYILSAVITFGLAFSMANTDGPFGLYHKARMKVRKRYGEDTWQDTGVNCPICLSFWIALPIAYSLDLGVSGWLFSFGALNIIMALSPD